MTPAQRTKIVIVSDVQRRSGATPLVLTDEGHGYLKLVSVRHDGGMFALAIFPDGGTAGLGVACAMWHPCNVVEDYRADA